jgi:hypothetical protein
MTTHFQRSVEAVLCGPQSNLPLSHEQTFAALLQENFQLRSVIIDLLLELEGKKEDAAFS